MASITTKDNLFTNFLFREVATAVAVEVIEVGEEEGEEKDGVEEKDEVEGKDEVEENVEQRIVWWKLKWAVLLWRNWLLPVSRFGKFWRWWKWRRK